MVMMKASETQAIMRVVTEALHEAGYHVQEGGVFSFTDNTKRGVRRKSSTQYGTRLKADLVLVDRIPPSPQPIDPKLRFKNLAGTLVRENGFLSWFCPLCLHTGTVKHVRKTCPNCKSKPKHK